MSERITMALFCKPQCQGIQVTTKERARDLVERLQHAGTAGTGLWLTNATGHETWIPEEVVRCLQEVSEVEMQTEDEKNREVARALQEQMARQALAGGPGIVPLVRPH
jgi:hypothetical protein